MASSDVAPWPYARLILLPPIIIGLTIGLGQFGSVRFESRLVHAGFGVVSLLFNWLAMEAFSALAAKAARPFRLPLWVPLLAGVLMACLLHAPFTILRDSFFTPFLRDGSAFFQTWPWAFNDPKYLTEAAISFFNRALIWLTFNYFAIHALGVPRFGYSHFFYQPSQVAARSAEPVSSSPVVEPGPSAKTGLDLLMQKLPPHVGKAIISLKAQEHYTEVTTRQGSALVYMRFSDAVALLGTAVAGAQIHRSHWVARDAVERVEREDGKLVIHLANGETLPVGRTYQHQARSLASASQ